MSAAVLAGTPYTLAYDMADIAIPIAFLAADQVRCRVLRGEQTILLGLFAAGLPILFTAERAPLGAAMLLMLLGLMCRWRAPTKAFETGSP